MDGGSAGGAQAASNLANCNVSSVSAPADRVHWEIGGDRFSEKVINDPVHGTILIDDYLWKFIDTPQFQRLRYLKQLGSCYFVFPGTAHYNTICSETGYAGASHNRFEHSIGVSHLAQSMARRFYDRRNKLDIDVTEEDIGNVSVAGLLHDLGHGPFSHVFDGAFIPKARPGYIWTHEMASEKMFDYMLEEEIDGSKIDVNEVKAMIAGTVRRPSQRYLYEIVANKRNGIDVDKFDYIARDSMFVQFPVSFKSDREMLMASVVESEIVFKDTEAFNLHQLFMSRFNLFKQVYTHKVSKGIELMIVDAMLLADEHLRLSDSIDDMAKYLDVTDSVLEDISRTHRPDDEKWTKAQEILKRIKRRRIYKCVGSVNIPSAILKDRQTLKSKVETDSIMSFIAPEHEKSVQSKDDIYVHWLELGYGMQDLNPINLTKFYGKYNPKKAFSLTDQQISELTPPVFSEVTVRVYVKDPNPDAHYAVHLAFKAFWKSISKEYGLTYPCGNDWGVDCQPTPPGSDSTTTTPVRARAQPIQGSPGQDLPANYAQRNRRSGASLSRSSTEGTEDGEGLLARLATSPSPAPRPDAPHHVKRPRTE
ncbi:hypothetical protein DFJ73DRAFT_263681 [Zopfochytrium polystomum]|nr:hypothetical protein DFJ73DRAFT_263681 [Zopfochytrium polystomum]